MTDSHDIRAKALSLLPQLSSSEQTFLEELPEKYCLNVPYRAQQEKHFCAAACVQMLQSFYGDPTIDQYAIAHIAGWTNWRHLNHESFAEDLARLMAKLNFLPARYYPGAYVLPKFETGIEGADFIVQNRELFADIDFSYFKSALYKSKSPIFCRIHFVSDEYPMPEEMIAKLDNSGHSLLMVGFNEEGFIFHDPWDKEKWGGTRGGEYVTIPYFFLKNIRPLVNCCKEQIEHFSKIACYFELPRQAVTQGRTIELALNIEWSGFAGIFSRSAPAIELSAHLRSHPKATIKSSTLAKSLSTTFTVGSKERFTWEIELEDSIGSAELEATVLCSVQLPAYAWEEHAKDEIITVRARAATRLDIKSTEWLNKYGRFQ